MSTVFSPFPEGMTNHFRAESIAAYSAIDGYTRVLQKYTLQLHKLLPCYRQNSVKPTLNSSFIYETFKQCQNKSWRTQQQFLLTDSDVILNYWNVLQFYLSWSVYKKDAWKAKKMLKVWNSERNYHCWKPSICHLVIFNSGFCLSQFSHQQVYLGTVPTTVLNFMEYIAKEM